MAGVSLVGFSGSLIKDTVREVVVNAVSTLAGASRSLPMPEPIERPEATKVLIGELLHPSLVFSSKLTTRRQGVLFILFAQIL
jgi:hypothetical protein